MKDTQISIEILLLTDLLHAGVIDDKVYSLAVDKIRKESSTEALLGETA